MNSEPQPSNFDEKLGAIVGLVTGTILLSVGLWVHNTEAQRRATLIEAQGTVVDNVALLNSGRNQTGMGTSQNFR